VSRLLRSLDYRARSDRDGGFTLIEFLVAIVISAILATVILSLSVATRKASMTTSQEINLTAEARTALNRMVTDLQEAVPLTVTASGNASVIPAITAAANPDGPNFDPNAVTSITFNFDADGDGCIAGIASNNIIPAASAPACSSSTPAVNLNAPETETFCWDPSTQLISLIPQNPSPGSGFAESTPVTQCSGGTPLLAGKITAFEISYRSSIYRFQNISGKDFQNGACTGTSSIQCGVTTWYDLDAAGPPVGNNNGLLDSPELQNVDSLVISMTLSQNGHSQHFSTQVNLRNVHPNA
jgi:prepilin-type N-terminal cleavage/methylation domain-containing protein